MVKRYVTLVEVLIAMALVSVLMTVLMGYYAELEFLHAQTDRAREEGFQMRYLQTRLSYVLPRIVSVTPPVQEPEKKRDFYFFTSTEATGINLLPSLVFVFDNGIDLDPYFSNNVLGRLMIEESEANQKLVLLTWPVPRCWKKEGPPPVKLEVLIDKVTDMEYAFFYPGMPQNAPAVDIKGVQTKPLAHEDMPEPNQWHDMWNMAYVDLPAVIKLRIKRSVQTGLTPADQWIELAFPIPGAKKPIVMGK